MESISVRKENRQRQLKKCVKEKVCYQMSFTDWFRRSVIFQRLVGFTRQKKEIRKNHCAAYVLVICWLTRVINGKRIEDEAIYNFLAIFG